MLRNCERASSARTMKTPSSSPSGKRTLTNTPQRRKLLSDLPVFKWFGLADCDCCFWRCKRDCQSHGGYRHHKIGQQRLDLLAFVPNTSLADTEPALQWIVTGLMWAGILDLFQRVLLHIVVPVWYCSHGNRSKTALRACSSSIKSAYFVSVIVRWPWAMGPYGCGARILQHRIHLMLRQHTSPPCTNVQWGCWNSVPSL